jgi:hypothetical protein
LDGDAGTGAGSCGGVFSTTGSAVCPPTAPAGDVVLECIVSAVQRSEGFLVDANIDGEANDNCE